jgi:hypothetical protein
VVGRKEQIDATTENSLASIPLRLTSLLQVFCPGCEELDQRCLSRLIWAPKATNKRVRHPQAVVLHQNFQELKRGAAQGCYSCRLWKKSLLDECHSEETVSDLQKYSFQILATPPISTIRPWIMTIETKTASGEALRSRLLLENEPYVSTPSKLLTTVSAAATKRI